MQDFSFSNQTILLTGASGGIGAAIAERLAKQGCSLVLTARHADRLEQLAAHLRTLGSGNITVIPADMADYDSVSRFSDQLEQRAINLDGVAFMVPQPHRSSETMPPNAEWDTLFKTSFTGPLSLLKAAIGRMTPDPAQGKRCKIVIVSGISSAQILSHYASGNVIRLAWVGQAKTLAFALGPRGIHVNTLSLGGTLSPWYIDSIRQRAEKAGKSYDDFLVEDTANVPLRKYASPMEAAKAVEGLLSPFSDHMTGVNILHDGGFTRAY